MPQMIVHYNAVMNPGGGMPFGVWIVIVIVLVAVGGALAITRGPSQMNICSTTGWVVP